MISSVLCFAAAYYAGHAAVFQSIDRVARNAINEVMCCYLSGDKSRRFGDQIPLTDLPAAVQIGAAERFRELDVLQAYFITSGDHTSYTLLGEMRGKFYMLALHPDGGLISSRELPVDQHIARLGKNFPAWMDENTTGTTYFRVLGPKGKILAGVRNDPHELFTPSNPLVRVYERKFSNGVTIQVAYVLRELHEQLQGYLVLLFGVFTVILLIGFGGGWLLSGCLTTGLRKVCEAAQRIAAGDLSQRLPPVGNSYEIKELVDSFNIMSDNLEHLVSELRTVTDDVAHDLRTPVTRIRGIAEVTMRTEGRTLSDHCCEALGSIAEECDSMISMINVTLELARTEAGLHAPNMQELRLDELLKRVFELYRQTAEDAHFDWRIELPDHPIPFLGDAGKLQRMLANLLDNAIRYLPPEGHCILKLIETDKQLVLSISDSGPGIPDEFKEKVFKRFFRMDNSRTGSGHGLGLSLVRAIVHAHGGTITLSDTPGGGATFTICFPRVAATP